MANISGYATIGQISDSDMVKIYEFKEKHGTAFTFNISTQNPSGQPTPVPPVVTLGWAKLEGAQAVVDLIKKLQEPVKV